MRAGAHPAASIPPALARVDRRFLKPKAAVFWWRHANLNLFLKEKRFSFSFATKAAPSVVSERVDCWLPHRPPANIAHPDRLPTPISRSGSVFICQDSLWHLREVIRSGRPCSPWKSDTMRSTTPSASSNHPVTRSTAHNQPVESVTPTEQDHSKESFFNSKTNKHAKRIFVSHPRETKIIQYLLLGKYYYLQILFIPIMGCLRVYPAIRHLAILCAISNKKVFLR